MPTQTPSSKPIVPAWVLRPWALAAAVHLTACSGASIDGGSSSAKLIDVVWCDIQAVPCVSINDPGNGLPASCNSLASAPIPASVPGGNRICFDSTTTSPEAACTALCNPGSQYASMLLYPPHDPITCSASVNKDASNHPGLNARGFRSSACTGVSNYEREYLSGAGTNTVAVSGTGTASYGGASVGVTVRSGRFTIAAPNTWCSSLQTSCTTQINQIELDLDDFSLPSVEAKGLTLYSDGPLLTASGEHVAPQPPAASNPSFLFTIPPGMAFDAIGDLRINDVPFGGIAMVSASEVSAVIDLTNGGISFQFSIRRTIAGQVFTLVGVATTSAVIDQAPVVTAPATASLVAGSTCNVDMTLSATASSPVGLPVTLSYAVDDGAGSLPGPTATTTLFGLGSHRITIMASDTLGAMTTATEMVTVTGPSSCP
jgi:hypothetical protein